MAKFQTHADKVRVWWDAQDPANEGWAWTTWTTTDTGEMDYESSGPLDDVDDETDEGLAAAARKELGLADDYPVEIDR